MNISHAAEGRWYEITNADEISSPALVMFPDRIEENIRGMIRTAGSPDRLRPHVKTHKTAEIVALQMKQGIAKFKCATIAEGEMTAACGARDVLLAMQPVGPAVGRFFALKAKFPGSAVSAIVDSEPVVEAIATMAASVGTKACLWLDVNSGMNRTGVAPGADAVRLYRLILERPWLEVGGLHVYDGNIHEPDLAARTRECEAQFAPVQVMIDDIRRAGLPIPAVVAGGTPTFPIHARREGVELSPGTTLLWDYGYRTSYPDLDYLLAALLLTRVVSKPATNLVCLDLGTKAVATEMPQPRVSLLGVGPYRIVGHNEEHLVIETADAGAFHLGDVVYAVPEHICPTVAKYEAASVIDQGRCTGEWRVAARNRTITI